GGGGAGAPLRARRPARGPRPAGGGPPAAAARLDGRLPVGLRQLLRPRRPGTVRPRHARTAPEAPRVDEPAQGHRPGARGRRGPAAARGDYRRVEEGRPDEHLGASREPTPSQQVAGAELVQEFQRRLTADERALAERRKAGRDWNQIAEEFGGSAEALRKQ